MNYWKRRFKRLFDDSLDDNTYPKMQALHTKLDSLCTVLGCNVIRSLDWKPDIRTYWAWFLIGCTLVCASYTQWIYFMRGKYLDMFLCFIYYGMDFQVAAKMYYSITKRELLYAVSHQMVQIHAKYQYGEERIRILNVCFNRCDKLYKIIRFLYINCMIGFLSFPLIIYIFTKERTMFIQVLVIGFTEDTTFNYIVNMLYQLIIMIWTLVGLLACDIVFLCVTAHYVCLTDLFEVGLKELANELKYDGSWKYKKRIKNMLKTIIIEHEYMNTFLNDQDDLYTNICFFEIAATNFICITLLFVETFIFWFPGYGLGLATLVQFLLFCTVGTVVENASERTMHAIYDVPWYFFEKERALEFLIMFQKAQNPSFLSIGGLKPLSVATAKEILNTMYSHYTMFLSFIDNSAAEKLLGKQS